MSDAQGNTVVLDKYGNQAVEPIKHVTREDIELIQKSVPGLAPVLEQLK